MLFGGNYPFNSTTSNISDQNLLLSVKGQKKGGEKKRVSK